MTHTPAKRKTFRQRVKHFSKVLGPGLITGASDDDPSGIVTYTQAGARFGLTTLWTALLTFPMMAAIQEMCARIGLVTSHGLAGTIKTYYPRWLLYVMLLFSFPAIVLNIGADIAGIGAVGNLLVPSLPPIYFSVIFTVLLLILMVYLPYRKIANVLKYLCAVLLVYILVPFLYHQDLGEIVRSTFLPKIRLDEEFLSILVAILGTTISPYLFFWQATMEAEEVLHRKRKLVVNRKVIQAMREDIDIGMLFSSLVFYFIILTAGTVLYSSHIYQIDTVEQAALALRPLAGDAAYILFAVGVIGTGLLAIPVLSGSLSYMVSETFGWSGGLDKKFHEARAFYVIMALSLVLGLSLNYIGISPIKALLYAAILYGLTAPVLIAMVLHISNNKVIMGRHTNGWISNALGILTLMVMTAAAVGLMVI